jgi:hypothetical protein
MFSILAVLNVGLCLNRSILLVRLCQLESKAIELKRFLSIDFVTLAFVAPTVCAEQSTDWRVAVSF